MDDPTKEKAPPRCQPGTGNENSSRNEAITSPADGKRPFIPAWLDDAGLSAATFRLYCHLSRSADNDTGIAWPSYERMGKVCGISRATINRCLTELISRNLIEKAEKQYFGRSTRYMVLVPIVAPEARLSDANSIISGTIGVPIVAPENCNRASGEASIVAPEAREGNPKKVLQRRKPEPGLFPIGEALPFPSTEFKAAWQSWERHRMEIKKKLTPESIRQQFKKFADMGEGRAIAAINHSIANGWQGIFEPSGHTSKEVPTTSPAPAGSAVINGRVFTSKP